tara:strand:+ start:175 stop:576 length:402 start_codon:yes stop_codon:yes gene_type:complete
MDRIKIHILNSFMTYEDLKVWLISENMDDSWVLILNDKPAKGRFSLDEVRDLSESCRNTDFKVLHDSHSECGSEEWMAFEETITPVLAEIAVLRSNVREIGRFVLKIRDYVLSLTLWIVVIPVVAYFIVRFLS